MDELKTFTLRESISDAIGILDSAPIRSDMFPQMYFLQIGNRIPMSHLAVELGLKGLIRETAEQASSHEVLAWLEDGRKGRTHSLASLYSKLREVDDERAKFLAEAFQNAVKFFGYDTKRDGFAHFRSIDSYLSIVATGKVFEALRYWVIEGTPEQEEIIGLISPEIHREILCALRCLFFPTHRETVSERVEREVSIAMFDSVELSYNTRDIKKKLLVEWYMHWLFEENSTGCEALKEAKDRDFIIRDGDDFIEHMLRRAWTKLGQSEDPAVRYFASRLTYLPEGSQTQDPNAIPKIEWTNEGLSCKIETPSGICLGFARRQPDGAWSILPMQSGATGTIPPAVKLKDAANFLLQRLTRQVTINVSDRIIQTRIVWDKDLFVGNGRCELAFWDAEHGLAGGDHVLVTLHPLEKRPIVHQFRGSITEVENQSVTIEGTNRIRVWGDMEK